MDGKKKIQIPKVIHYCWFGGKELPKEMKAYIKGWQSLCPDFEIKEWNEHNFDVNSCKYIREAYKAKKWAFVSDYARFKVLYEEGGVYFDTDVELVKPIDKIIQNGPYLGLQCPMSVAPGLGMAMVAGNKFCQDMLEIYENSSFTDAQSSRNIKTIVDYTTEYFIPKGLRDVDEIQDINGILIYPQRYFNPCDLETHKITITADTVSIHHYAGTWVDPYSAFRGKVYATLKRFGGKKLANIARLLFGRKVKKL